MDSTGLCPRFRARLSAITLEGGSVLANEEIAVRSPFGHVYSQDQTFIVQNANPTCGWHTQFKTFASAWWRADSPESLAMRELLRMPGSL
mmetsp:Transcript_156890/g.273074  ORF Transcript_156890/g.273074 Transcript_156890/m.273074 type:complete len:90 (-) Transcript_156890:43-312(-)